MASISTQPADAVTPTLVMTLKGHEKKPIQTMSYFPDGKQMVSVSFDKTARRWELQTGEEVEKVRDVCEYGLHAVAVSRDGRWVITAGGNSDYGELKACEVGTGIVKKFQGHSETITCIDISADCMLLASGSWDSTVRIWSLDTGKLVASPIKSVLTTMVGAVRFSQNSKKLAVNGWAGKCLEVWDVKTQKLDRKVGNESGGNVSYTPVFWTKQGTILAAFTFADSSPTTIYEFDASTLDLDTVGAPFEGHSKTIRGLALSFDGALLASTSDDQTIKLWAFESRQLLASFHVVNPDILVFSPNAHQVAYTTRYRDDCKIYICNIPTDILVSNGLAPDALAITVPVTQPQPKRARPPPGFFDNSEAIYPPHHLSQPANAGSEHPAWHSRIKNLVTRLPFLKQSQQTQPEGARLRHPNEVKQLLQQHLSFRRSRPSNDQQVVEVAPGRKFTRLAVVNLPEYKKVGDTRRLPREQQQPGVLQDATGNDPSSESSDRDSLPDVHWCKALFCYCSCWSHGRLRVLRDGAWSLLTKQARIAQRVVVVGLTIAVSSMRLRVP